MTGGVRYDVVGGTSGRARFDCTITIALQIGGDGNPLPPTYTSSGTVTWEERGTVTVHSCGA